MSKNTKKIERLQKKITDINDKLKADTKIKAQYEKELEQLQSEEMLIYIKSNKVTLNENFLDNLKLADDIQKSGISAEEIRQLITPQKEDIKNV